MANADSAQRVGMHPVLRWLARLLQTASTGGSVVLGLLLLFVVASLFAGLADRVQDWRRMNSGAGAIKNFLVPLHQIEPQACTGPLCALAPAAVAQWYAPVAPAGTWGTAVLKLPDAVRLDAPAGGYFTDFNWTSDQTPVFERHSTKRWAGEPSNAPFELMSAVSSNGSKAPVMGSQEGYFASWVQYAAPADASPEIWSPKQSWTAARGGEKVVGSPALNQLKLRTVFFRPMSQVVSITVTTKTAKTLKPGMAAVLFLRPQIELTRPYGDYAKAAIRGHIRAPRQFASSDEWLVEIDPIRWDEFDGPHWLSAALQFEPAQDNALPNTGMLFAFDNGPVPPERRARWQMGVKVHEMGKEPVWVLPQAAFDAVCSFDGAPNTGCVWAVVAGVAMPIQISVFPLDSGSGTVAVRERGAVGGKAIAPKLWAQLEPSVRRQLLEPSSATGLSRRLINDPKQIIAVALPPGAAGKPAAMQLQK